MATNITPTLKRVLRELQALRARIDQQIKVVQGIIRTTRARPAGSKRSVTEARPSVLVGYARDRRVLLQRKGLKKIR